jgi:hypothetical protein
LAVGRSRLGVGSKRTKKLALKFGPELVVTVEGLTEKLREILAMPHALARAGEYIS